MPAAKVAPEAPGDPGMIAPADPTGGPGDAPVAGSSGQGAVGSAGRRDEAHTRPVDDIG
jgi:hypothetical protein